MANPLLEPLIISLSPIERGQIQDWLACPLHNLRQDVTDLFDRLCTIHSYQQSPTELSIAPIGKAVDDRLLRSYLLERLEDFLRWQQIQKQQGRASIDLPLLRAYQNRGLQQHLSNRIRRQHKLSQRHRLGGVQDLYNAYQLEELRHEVSLINNRKLDDDYNQPNLFLLRAQVASGLRRAAHSLASTRLSKSIPDLPLLQQQIQLAQSHPFLMDEPAILLYFQLCCYYQPSLADNLMPFQDLIQAFKTHLNSFPPPEQIDLIKLIINQAIRRINQEPSTAHLREALELYELGIQRELLIEHQRISVFTFSNIIGIAIRLKETDFAETFLRNHANFLPPENAEEVIALNRARLAYATNQYKSALLHLQRADYRDNIHLMNARDLQIRIYYENGDHEALRDLIRATRSMIKRRNFGYHSKVYRNNLRLVSKLLNLRWERPTAVEKLRKEIQETHPLTERDWLLKQLGN